jgi:hypothetical protein
MRFYRSFPARRRRKEIPGVASKGRPMGWVVKQCRLDALEHLLADAARADLSEVRLGAERDVRRARRAAGRAVGSAATELAELERLGAELHAAVRDERASLRSPDAPPAPAGPVDPVAAAAPAAPPTAAAPAAPPTAAAPVTAAAPPPAAARPRPAPSRGSRRRPGRASLHSSALTELFRATVDR